MKILDRLMGREKQPERLPAGPAPDPYGTPVPEPKHGDALAVEVFAEGTRTFWWFVIPAHGRVGRDGNGWPHSPIESGVVVLASAEKARREGQQVAERIAKHGVGQPIERWVAE